MKEALSAWFGMIIIVYIVVIFAPDVQEYNEIIKNDFKTPWYTTNWFTSPYTNFQLKGKHTVEYWKQNAIKSENWFVREVTVSDKTFWTVLKRVENNGDANGNHK